MAAEAAPLNVLVVSEDTATLYDLSWMLSAVGYAVEATKHSGPDAAWRRYAEADFVLLDGRALSQPYESALAHESENPVYWILLYDPHVTAGFAAWYGAGGHDLLRVPVSRGELLTRMRAGARFLEFERRLRQRSGEALVCGMLSKRGLVRKMNRLSAKCNAAAAQHTLIVTAIDWYEGIRRKDGQLASRALVNDMARALKQTVGEKALTAYLGKGRFAALLLGHTAALARTAVKQMARGFSDRLGPCDAVARPTWTTAIVPWRTGHTPQQLLESGLTTLELARQSGGDCVFEHGNFSKELAAWQNEMAAGNPFANVVARDIMEPFPAVLESGAEQSAMIAALRRAGVPVCPYVDRQGRLVGVASADSLADEAAQPASCLTALPIAKPTTIPHHATFPEIYEAFSTLACSTLIVVADGRPLGYLTLSGFLSLIEPIDTTTFTPTGDLGDDSKQLIVVSSSSESDAAMTT